MVGGRVKSKLKLNSAKAEAKASSLGLAELGKTCPVVGPGFPLK